MDEAIHLPDYNIPIPVICRVLYYGVCVPIAYIGNLFTYIIVCKILKYRDSVPDVLVGALALNDFLTAVIVFTPSIIADIRQQWFPNLTFCRFHSVVKDWYIYTTFGIIVLISLERWTAITKPYFYRRHVTSFKMKVLVAVSGLFCLLSSSMPLVNHGVALKPGWYCSLVELENHTDTNRTAYDGLPLINIGINCAYLAAGILAVSACNISIIYQLKTKKSADVNGRVMEKKFAKLMGVICCFFLLTWIPNLISHLGCLHRLAWCHEAEFWARYIVNIGVSINPIVYGVMKKTYRRGYLYLLHMTVYLCTFTLIKKPPSGATIFDLREGSRVAATAKIADSSESSDQSNKSNDETNDPSPSPKSSPNICSLKVVKMEPC